MSDLVKLARERVSNNGQTHWVGCERDHRECLIQRMADEIERLRAERDDLLTKLDVESGSADVIARERDELRRQLAEAELDARRYRWIAGHCRSTSEHWGGRWSIVVEGPCPAKHDEEGAFDAAIDAAMGGSNE